MNPSEPINFVENEWHYLSPFSAHEVEVGGVVYKTAEHAYQALRVKPEARASILFTSSPMDAWREGQKCKEGKFLIDGYDKDALMEKIFRAKLSQHEDIKRILLESGECELLKVHATDYYWGTGADGTGKNKIGKF